MFWWFVASRKGGKTLADIIYGIDQVIGVICLLIVKLRDDLYDSTEYSEIIEDRRPFYVFPKYTFPNCATLKMITPFPIAILR
jgi:hypothetical protein